MALAIDIMHERGPSNEMCPQLQPKTTKVRLYWLLIKHQKVYYVLYITNKLEHGPCHQYNAWMWPW